jgi:hypothetical protein
MEMIKRRKYEKYWLDFWVWGSYFDGIERGEKKEIRTTLHMIGRNVEGRMSGRQEK